MTIGIGVSTLGYGISSSATRCELWDILKGDPAGQFSELWSCECAFGIHADREIDYMQAISTCRRVVDRCGISDGASVTEWSRDEQAW